MEGPSQQGSDETKTDTGSTSVRRLSLTGPNNMEGTTDGLDSGSPDLTASSNSNPRPHSKQRSRARGASIIAQPLDIVWSKWDESQLEDEYSSGAEVLWKTLKLFLLFVFIIPFLPILTTDLYIGKIFGSHKIVMAWFFMDKGHVTRIFWLNSLRKIRWYIPIGIQMGEYILICMVMGYLYDKEGGATPKVMIAVQSLFAGGIIIIFFLLLSASVGNRKISSVNFPSKAARMTNRSNWVPILSGVYDFFTLNSLVVRPQVFAPVPVPYLDKFLKACTWLFLPKVIMYIVAMTMAWSWVFLCFHVYFRLDVGWQINYVFNSRLIAITFPWLSQTFFLFIIANVLQGLKQEDDSWIAAKDENFQWFIMCASLITLLLYCVSAFFYWGWVNEMTDDYFIRKSEDFRFPNLYNLLERLCKVTMATSVIFMTYFSERTALTLTNLVSVVVCLGLTMVNAWMKPCSVRGMNYFKTQTYFMIFWSVSCSLLAIHVYSDPITLVANTWVPTICLVTGWSLSFFTCLSFYLRGREADRLKEGELYTWGFRPSNRLHSKWSTARRPEPVFLPEKIKVDRSECGRASFIFVISTTGGVYSFGKNDRGQLGHGDDTYRFKLTPLTSLWLKGIMAAQLSCGGEHVLLRTQVGLIYSWGRGNLGQLGHGDISDVQGPKRVRIGNSEEKTNCRMVAANRFGSVVVMEPSGDIYTFGCNTDGQLGLGKSFETFGPKQEPNEWVDDPIDRVMRYRKDSRWLRSETELICCKATQLKEVVNLNVTGADGGSHHTCFWTDEGDLYVTGSNSYGQLGLGSQVESKLIPAKVTEPSEIQSNVIQVSCGEEFTMVLLKNGSVYVMGRGSDGQLGIGPGGLDGKTVPVRVNWFSDINTKIVSVNAGSYHSAAITEDGKVFVWGRGEQCQLGTGRARWELNPYPLKRNLFHGEAVDAVDLGKDSTVFLTASGLLYVAGTGMSEVGLGCQVSHKAYVDLPAPLFKAEPSELLRPSSSGESERDINVDVSSLSAPSAIKPVNPLQHTHTRSPSVPMKPAANEAQEVEAIPLLNRHAMIEEKTQEQPQWLTSERSVDDFSSEKEPAGTEVTELVTLESTMELKLVSEERAPAEAKIKVGISQQLSKKTVQSVKQLQDLAARKIQRLYRQHLDAQLRQDELMEDDDDEDSALERANNPRGLFASPNTSAFPKDGPSAIRSMSLGRDHGALVTNGGKVWVFGSNAVGQLGIGQIEMKDDRREVRQEQQRRNRFKLRWTAQPLPPILGAKSVHVKQVSCGNRYTMILLEDHTLWGLGIGLWGQLGLAGYKVDERSYQMPSAFTYSPRKLTGFGGDDKIVSVQAGTFHTVALCENGDVYSWGSDGKAVDSWYDLQLPRALGVLGRGDELLGRTDGRPGLVTFPPDLKANGDKVVEVSLGLGHTLARTEQGQVFSWGWGYYGMLGLGEEQSQSSPIPGVERPQTSKNTNIPTKVALDGPARSIAAGKTHSAAVLNNGKVYTWGMGGHGALGHGTGTDLSLPKEVSALTGVFSVSAGTYQTAFLMEETGQLYISGTWVLGALGAGDIHHTIYRPRAMGALLGRVNRGIVCGNHWLAAW
eukprot:gb/GEZN01000307.1/.p1 GENE.gb/GEZN01000307.1/~~gb/GEZN01000307.1/.p1  ORF type:complete len:1585 (+),score=211.01 gb/GEZN01000307.1/:87-4841(+)